MYKITILHQKSYPMKERGNTARNQEKKKLSFFFFFFFFDKMRTPKCCSYIFADGSAGFSTHRVVHVPRKWIVGKAWLDGWGVSTPGFPGHTKGTLFTRGLCVSSQLFWRLYVQEAVVHLAHCFVPLFQKHGWGMTVCALTVFFLDYRYGILA